MSSILSQQNQVVRYLKIRLVAWTQGWHHASALLVDAFASVQASRPDFSVSSWPHSADSKALNLDCDSEQQTF